ncbi:hypothetical protein QQX98_006303 [Neonectria punicea]|uniref:Uncharacterized protein n=1 Tax=Neonectria punicea TaxID=979145 RepID=A0ABR1H1D7_9HYPO
MNAYQGWAIYISDWYNSEEHVLDSVTIHADCFNLFLSEARFKNKVRRLYALAHWTRPWDAVSTLRLDPGTNIQKGIGIAAKAYSMPQLRSLPAEMVNIIWEHSRSDVVWRYASVLDRIERISNPDAVNLDSVPLPQICFWERGTRPKTSAITLQGFVRLTIDSQGLKKIEHLETRPKPRSHSPNAWALTYVIDTEERFSETTVDFKARCTITSSTLILSNAR